MENKKKSEIEIVEQEISNALTKAVNIGAKEAELRIQELEKQFNSLFEIMDSKVIGADNFVEKYYRFHENDFQRFSGEKLDPSIKEEVWGFAGGSPEEVYTDAQHHWFMMASRNKARYSPHIRNIVNLMGAATLINMVKIDIANEEVDRKVNSILSANNLPKLLRQWIPMKYVDGELFVLIYYKDDGRMMLRTLDSQEVEKVVYHQYDMSMVVGIKRNPKWVSGDADSCVKYYEIPSHKWPDDFHDELRTEMEGKEELNKIGLYWKYGYRDGQRGELPLLPILRYDKIYEDILIDLSRLYHERARVLWIKKIKGNSVYATDRTAPPIRSGVYRLETDNIEWRVEDPHLADFNNDSYGRRHTLAMAAGVSFPEFLITQDSSSQSYATLRKADTPFTLTINDTQNMWSGNLAELTRVIIKLLIECEELPETINIQDIPQSQILESITLAKQIQENPEKAEKIFERVTELEEATSGKTRTIKTEEIPISIIWPRFFGDNPLQNAQALEVLRRSGLISQHTAIKLAGNDPELELILMQYDQMRIAQDQNEPAPRKKSKAINQKRSQTGDANYDAKLGRGTA